MMRFGGTSRLVNKSMCWESGKKGTTSASTILPLCISSFYLAVLELYLYNKTVLISIPPSSVLWVVLANYWTREMGCRWGDVLGTVKFTVRQAEAWEACGRICGWCLKGGKSHGTESLARGIWVNFWYLVSKTNCMTSSWYWRISVGIMHLVSEKHKWYPWGGRWRKLPWI